jgi:hypothetical protein
VWSQERGRAKDFLKNSKKNEFRQGVEGNSEKFQKVQIPERCRRNFKKILESMNFGKGRKEILKNSGKYDFERKITTKKSFGKTQEGFGEFSRDLVVSTTGCGAINSLVLQSIGITVARVER